MSGVIIRRAEQADKDTLFRLIEALADYERLDPPDAEAKGRLANDLWGPRPRVRAWIAEVDRQTAGYAFTFETYSTFLALPTLYLEDLFILPECRRSGIGRAFFQHLALEALSKGCGRMEWACLDWNELALGFYGKLGARRLDEWVAFRLTADQLEGFAGGGK
jgi:GNAT superfamily N-acetyltransferase